VRRSIGKTSRNFSRRLWMRTLAFYWMHRSNREKNFDQALPRIVGDLQGLTVSAENSSQL
jgi:hypothetical protein